MFFSMLKNASQPTSLVSFLQSWGMCFAHILRLCFCYKKAKDVMICQIHLVGADH